MKLVVTIPALDEEKTIGGVVDSVPREVDGIDEVEVLVIDDGSTDDTVEVAKDAGADRVVSFRANRGLAQAFAAGLEEAVSMGADIVVNTDADNQYDQKQIPGLIKPIQDGTADIVLGSRFRGWIEEMPRSKYYGNKIATWVTRTLSGVPVTDAQTGFRAFTRDAALRMNIQSDYTYVQETIMHAANNHLVIEEVPIDFLKREGTNSRLINSIWGYAKKSGATILRTYRDYQPLKVFTAIGILFFAAAALTGGRVLLHYLTTGRVTPYLPSAVLTALLLIVGVNITVTGLIADMLKSQKETQDEILYKLKKNGSIQQESNNNYNN